MRHADVIEIAEGGRGFVISSDKRRTVIYNSDSGEVYRLDESELVEMESILDSEGDSALHDTLNEFGEFVRVSGVALDALRGASDIDEAIFNVQKNAECERRFLDEDEDAEEIDEICRKADKAIDELKGFVNLH